MSCPIQLQRCTSIAGKKANGFTLIKLKAMIPLTQAWEVKVLIIAVILACMWVGAIYVGRWIKKKLHNDNYDNGFNYESYGPESNDKTGGDIFC